MSKPIAWNFLSETRPTRGGMKGKLAKIARRLKAKRRKAKGRRKQ